MKAIFKRELASYFRGFLGWLLAAMLTVLGGIYFYAGCLNMGSPEWSYYVLYSTRFLLLIFFPLLTMRSFAEERRQKTEQLLLASPVSPAGIVLGKYLAMLCVFLVPVAGFAVQPLLLTRFGSVSLAASYAALAAYVLLGAACIAIGMFLSSLTENAIVAGVFTFLALLLSYLMSGLQTLFAVGSVLALIVFAAIAMLAGILAGLSTRSLAVGSLVFCALAAATAVLFSLRSAALTAAFSAMLGALALFDPFTNFVSSLASVPALVYYASVAGLFVFFTVQSLEKRRWS